MVLDLTQLSGTVAYAQVYDMLSEPETYLGWMVRMQGPLNYLRNPNTGKEYFAVVIQDATACCAQGIEFIWAGEHRYPEDYPEPGTVVTVTGRFETYQENGHTYPYLSDAQPDWVQP